MPNPPSVFISYRQQVSGPDARYINDRLVAMGVKVFFDADGIHAGDNWRAALEQNLLASDYLIVILAPATLESEWVRREVEFALRHSKPVIPIITAGLPNLYNVDFSQYPEEIAALRDLQYIEYYYKRPQPTFDALAAVLKVTPTLQQIPFSSPPTPVNQSPLENEKPPKRNFPMSGCGSALVVVLGLAFAFLALFPEQTRTDWFRSIGLLPSLTLTPSATAMPPTITASPVAATETLLPTVDMLPITATESAQRDATATEIVIQRTANAALVAESTHLVETANAVPSATWTPKASDTSLPPRMTASSLPPTPTASLTVTLIPPTVTSSPTNTLQTSQQVAGVSGYPCSATIVDNTGNATIINQVHSEPIYASSPIASVRVGQAVFVQKKELEGSRTVWYQINNDQGTTIGYILEDYVRLSPSCPQ